MKVAVITFHRAINYGGVLQAFALQRFLENLSIESLIIDYKNETFQKQYSPIQNSDNVIKNIIRLVMVSPQKYFKNRRFSNFLQNNTKMTRSCLKKDLPELCNQYDYILTGSDQVFNLCLTDYDYAYFLDFVNDHKKKISYAASLGGLSLCSENGLDALLYLKQFAHLSIREASGVAYLKQQGIKSVQHIDPTLLLKPIQWKSIIHEVKYQNYVLLYTLGKGAHVDNTIAGARKLAKKHGLRIIYINDTIMGRQNDITYIGFSSPEMFVSLFAMARVIVTNSFHGTAFSIIFCKEFYANWNMPENKGTRIKNLLELLGINQENFDIAIANESARNIDWNNVEEVLDKERVKSIEYFAKLEEGVSLYCLSIEM